MVGVEALWGLWDTLVRSDCFWASKVPTINTIVVKETVLRRRNRVVNDSDFGYPDDLNTAYRYRLVIFGFRRSFTTKPIRFATSADRALLFRGPVARNLRRVIIPYVRKAISLPYNGDFILS